MFLCGTLERMSIVILYLILGVYWCLPFSVHSPCIYREMIGWLFRWWVVVHQALLFPLGGGCHLPTFSLSGRDAPRVPLTDHSGQIVGERACGVGFSGSWTELGVTRFWSWVGPIFVWAMIHLPVTQPPKHEAPREARCWRDFCSDLLRYLQLSLPITCPFSLAYRNRIPKLFPPN
jgi:hypothetical protein